MPAQKLVLPPSPPKHFLVGHLPEFLNNPRQFLMDSAKAYGDIFCIYPPTGEAYVLNNLEHIKYVLVDNNDNFVKFKLFHMFKEVLGNGLLTSEGDFWLRQRRLMQPAFPKHIPQSQQAIVTEMTNQLAESWQDGQVIDLYREMMQHTLRIIAKILFNVDISNDADVIGKAFDKAMDALQQRLVQPVQMPHWIPTSTNLEYKKAIEQLNTLIYSIIENRRADRRKDTESATDLLSLLIQSQDTDGSRMTNLQIRDEVMTLLFAGHETSCVILTWAFYLLAINPQAEEKLVAELHSSETISSLESLAQFKYTEAVVKETLRLYPPVWITGREGVKDCEIGGYKIPAGKQIWVSPWVLHHNKDYYPEPEKFSPERWLVGNSKLPKLAYIPFGAGPHLCIGNNFAMMEITTIIPILHKFFHFQPIEKEVLPERLSTPRPHGGFKVRLQKRN